MKIGIIAPSPVPYTIGGAEKLWWGLLDHLNENTSHQAEIIKLPSPEGNFWELIDSYRQFSELDLSHFDLVISGKYPAWMVAHPNHICYMLHRLRGLYDAYPYGTDTEKDLFSNPQIRALENLMSQNKGVRSALAECFASLERMREDSQIPPAAFSFPGPLARKVIHFLDDIGLSPASIRRFSAISRNITRRKGYFPSGVAVDVIYPPSNLKHLHRGASRHLFTASRLDGPKRVALLIEAMKQARARVQLFIGGTGPLEDQLREAARSDERITLLGFISDAQAIELYSDAIAVPYVPVDEDYGLVVIEAMKSGKPVLTASDSGGPNEFVVDGRTGFSVAPDPGAVAEKIDYLCEHLDEAHWMGANAEEAVRDVTWDRTISRLLALGAVAGPSVSVMARPKMTVATTFPIFPPRNGGQLRVFNLYRHLTNEYDVDLITLAGSNSELVTLRIVPGLREIRIPKTPLHEEADQNLTKLVGGIPATDVSLPRLFHLTPAYVDALRESASGSEFVVASHPYALPAIQAVTSRAIVFEAQDVEIELKRQVFPANEAAEELLRATAEVEGQCCRVAALIMVCAKEDGEALHRIYGADYDKIVEVPNGVDTGAVQFISPEERRLAKKRIGADGCFTAIFMGSWHWPNLVAVRNILKMARVLPEVRFLVVGSVGGAFAGDSIPPNVGFMGEVDDHTKSVALSVADVALNPMETGSGTNLKMLEYCAAGIPVISTPYGSRGLSFIDDRHIQIVELKGFPELIRQSQTACPELMPRVQRARRAIEERYDWAIIAKGLATELRKRISGNATRAAAE